MSSDKPSLPSHKQRSLHLSPPRTTATGADGTKSPSSSSMPRVTGYDVNLPPSIPISLDGEEGYYAYMQNLRQIKAEARSECIQPPPNITICRRLSDDYDDVLGAPFHYSSYTSIESTDSTTKFTSASPKRAERHYVGDTASFRSSARFSSPRKADPLPELPRRLSRELGSSGDYVGTSLFSAWRSTAASESTGSGSSAALPSRHHQPRSSSADSVRRLVKLKRFFVKKLSGRVPLLKQDQFSPQPLAESSGLVYDQLKGAKGGLDKLGVGGESPWDLPPNYVDMIFTRDPVTNENQSDVVEDLSKLEIRKV